MEFVSLKDVKFEKFDGIIPAHRECPFQSECEIKTAGNCNHSGKDHSVPFSCAAARGFAIVKEMKK